jgi:PAS domain S-box-containing protein
MQDPAGFCISFLIPFLLTPEYLSMKNNEIYTSLFQNNHSVMLIIHPATGAIIDANEQACRYYGYSKDELTAMTVLDINTLPPHEVKQEMQRAKQELRNHFFFCHQLASGDIREVEVHSGPIMFKGEKLLYTIVYDITERNAKEREREELIEKLEKAMHEIKQLQGIIPICASCKKIRDDKGAWNQLEAYISEHSEARFSHGICPECAARLYPELRLPAHSTNS